MALVVEDGTGLADANSYATAAEADAYFADRPTKDATWTAATAAAKDEALINATAYLDAEYGAEWLGEKADGLQALDWPRSGAVTRDGHLLSASELPAKLKSATHEAAHASLSQDLLARVDSPASGIKRTKDKVDVVTTEVEYTGAGADQRPKLPAIDGLVRELTAARGFASRIRG